MRIFLLTVLGSLFPGSFSKDQELKVDVDFPGHDVLQIYSPDVQHCQLACTQHHSCLFFTFVRSDWSKDNRNLSVTGYDYRQLTLNTFEDCQKECTSDPNCKFFSFTTVTFPDAEKRKKCFLKYSWTVPIPSVLIKTAGLLSGFSDSLFKTKEGCKEEILESIHYRGNDFENVPAASPQHCQFLCSTHPRCTHFTYTTSSYSSDPKINMHCFLKHTQDVNQLVSIKEEELFSGFSTRNCKPSNVWATTRYEGLDFLGNDYRNLKTDTAEICREMCTKDQDCHFYTYVLPSYHDQSIRKKCFLKYSWTVPIPSVLIKTAGLLSGFSDSLFKTKEGCKEEILENIHYRGNDFENVPAASPQHCQFLCSTHPRCTHFTYTTSSYSSDPKINMHCFLKHTQDVNQLVSVKEEELFSGFSTRNCKPSNVWATTLYEGLHFLGNDYRNLKTDTAEICREMCTKDPDCQFYTYVLPSYSDESIRYGCYLKQILTLPKPEKVVYMCGVRSGFSRRNCKTTEDASTTLLGSLV